MEWFNYLLKVSACSAFFFAFYLLVLRKLTFFKINRFYLLFALMLSFVIPALQFTVERELEAAPIIEAPIIAQDESLTEQISLAPIKAPVASLPVQETYNWFNLLPLVYITVVFALLALTCWRLFQLIKHAKQNTQEINGLKLVYKSDGFTNCSFFNYVFIDENSLTVNELQVLLKHEEVHAKQFHSVDKIFLMVVKAVLWFNTMIYLYDKALEQIHEYEADEVTSQNFGTTCYANLLLRLAVVKSDMPLVHNFVKSPIKERIKMLFNSKSKHMKKLLYLLALPIGMGLLWGFTVKVVEVLPKTAHENGTQKVNQQNVPFIQRSKLKGKAENGGGTIVITANNKTVGKIGSSDPDNIKLYFYINRKLYTEAEAMKFTPQFIAQLGSIYGVGDAKNNYTVPNVESNRNNYIVWFGTEPQFSSAYLKNKTIYEKYNGTTIKGEIIDFNFDKNKNLDGFLVKTTTGDKVMAKVEIKFTKEINTMIAKGDKVTLKIYNANYYENIQHPWVTSYKISKGGKLLFDKWPKVAKA